MIEATPTELPTEPVQVEITIHPLNAVIHRPHMIKEQVLRPLLEYSRQVFSAGGPAGWQQNTTTMDLFFSDLKKDIWIAAGIVPRVAAALRQHGYDVTIDDKREAGPKLDVAYFENCPPEVRKLLQVVEKEPRGQIEVYRLDDAIDVMHFVAKAFPHAYIGIAVATKAIASRICRQLAESLQTCIGLAYSGSRERHTHIYVGTYGILPAELDWRRRQRWDILFLPCADEATTVKVNEAFWRMRIPRTYAFINPQRRPDRLVQISIEQLAGPVIHRVGTRVVPVHVVFLPSPSETFNADKTPLERKRTYYWRNRERNRHIAHLANSIVTSDAEALVDAGVSAKTVETICPNARVAVVVESLEHARELKFLMPEWRVRAMDTEAGAPPTKRTMEIVTAVCGARERVRADIIINATGTEWPLRLKDFPPKVTEPNAKDVLILDFSDEFSPQARREAQRRAEQYRRCGYEVTLPPEESA